MREAGRDKGRLEHILSAIGSISSYGEGKTYEEFSTNGMMYYAVVKNIEIIGEAANMLTEEFRKSHSATPWRLIIGMRHYMVHEYFQVDGNVVWEFVTHDLPPLAAQVKSYLDEMDGKESD